VSKPVLIVDDAPDIRRTLKLIFDLAGVQSVEAGDGREALDLLDGGLVPGLVLLDWMMPVMDGRRFLSEVAERSARPELKTLPVYVLSAVDAVPDLDALAIKGWLKKPVAFDVLQSIMRLHCT
jgi:two-component system chemotaxis response regulator CheY